MKSTPTAKFRFDRRLRRWSFLSAGPHALGLAAASGSLEVNGRVRGWRQAAAAAYRTRGNAFAATFRYDDPAFEWSLVFEPEAGGNILIVRSAIRNLSAEPLTLGWCRLAQDESGPGGRLALGAHPERWLIFKAPWP